MAAVLLPLLLLLETCLSGSCERIYVCGCIFIFNLNKSDTRSGLTVNSRVFIAADR